MRYAAYIILIVCCLYVGFLSRSANIASRTTHADEAEQATTALHLRDSGEYKYNPNGPHGPSLYYWANAVQMPASLEAGMRDFRNSLTPVFVILLAAILISGTFVGRGAAWAAVSCLALSATAQIYSGYFVHELIFAFAVFSTALAVWLFARKPSLAAAAAAGIFAGLAQATKETAVISYAAMVLSLCVCAALDERIRQNLANALFSKKAFAFGAAFIAGAAAVAVPLYSSFGSNWGGLVDAVKSYSHFFEKSASEAHASGFAYYLKLLAAQKSEGVWFGEAPISILALAGLAFALAFRRKSPWRSEFAIFAFCNAAFSIAVLSFIKYKTPWLLFSPTVFLCVSAGFGACAILGTESRRAWIAGLAFAAILAFSQYRLSRNASVAYPSDPRNPFIYSHTVKDYNNLVSRLENAARVSEYESDIPVAFIMKVSPWPAPFDLRKYRNVGFWSGGKTPEDMSIFEAVVCDPFTEKTVAKSFGADKYEREYFGLRKNLILTLFIKKDIFDKIITGDGQ